jgi:hypothetical protein
MRFVPGADSGTLDFLVEHVYGDLTLTDLPRDVLEAAVVNSVSAGVLRRLERDKPMAERTDEELAALVNERVIQPRIVASWPMVDSLFDRSAIEAEVAATFPEAEIVWRNWVNLEFLTSPQSSIPEQSGVRTAILGSLLVIIITAIFSVPVGIGAAIYLEEYAKESRINQIIQTNIDNLAGVPSIIYGILGLAVFVRLFERQSLRAGGSHHRQWPDNSLGRPHPGVAGDAGHHHQCAGGHSGGATLVAGSRLRVGRHQVAGDLEPCAEQCAAGHSDRHDFGHVPCHWRNSAIGRRGRLYLHFGGSHQCLFQVHSVAHANLPVDFAPPA